MWNGHAPPCRPGGEVESRRGTRGRRAQRPGSNGRGATTGQQQPPGSSPGGSIRWTDRCRNPLAACWPPVPRRLFVAAAGRSTLRRSPMTVVAAGSVPSGNTSNVAHIRQNSHGLTGTGEGAIHANLNADWVWQQFVLLPKERGLAADCSERAESLIHQTCTPGPANMNLNETGYLLLPRPMNRDIDG